MIKRVTVLLVGLFTLGAGSWFAVDLYTTYLAKSAEVETAKGCNSCTLRHLSIARNKKARDDARRELGDITAD